MKEQIGHVDARPSKGVYQSIIVDYNLNIAISELVDNAIDCWSALGQLHKLTVRIDLGLDQQTVLVNDNAGGVPESDLRFLVSPGATNTDVGGESIGIFGVGGKRSVVALAQRIAITSRFKKERTILIEYDDTWLKSDNDWNVPKYQIDDIDPGCTTIELTRLRFTIDGDSIEVLRDHLAASYALFLEKENVEILLQNEPLKPRLFENWAYPPDYRPTIGKSTLITTDGSKIRFRGVAGLMVEPASIAGEYGVYFYCNGRLVARGLKVPEVGFKQPHHSISLVRVVVCLNGPANCMPWTSSKSSLNFTNNVFRTLRKWLLNNVSYYCSLSRRLQPEWDESVFRYTEGEPIKYKIDDFERVPASFRAPVPKMRPSYRDAMETANEVVSEQMPWIKGLYESVVAVDLIYRETRLEAKNRICLVVLDSTIEIAFKDFLLNHPEKPVGLNELKKRSREQIQDLVRDYGVVPNDLWARFDYFYRLRCQLIHERSGARITDDEINNFRNSVQVALQKMFEIRWVERNA